MIYVLIFLTELFILFILSGYITKLLSRLLFFFTRNVMFTTHLISIIFFPGVLIHELSHYLVAIFLFVPAGKIEFFPKLSGTQLKLGSVSIGKTDIIRRVIIGLAPVVVGVSLLAICSYFLFSLYSKNSLSLSLVAIFVYIIFEIGNTMFSSKKDMEGALPLLVLIVVIFLAIYFITGFSVLSLITGLSNPKIEIFLQKMNIFLLVPLFLDLAIYLLSKIFKV